MLRAYWKKSEKSVQWIEDMAKGGLGLFLRKKTWIWRKLWFDQKKGDPIRI